MVKEFNNCYGTFKINTEVGILDINGGIFGVGKIVKINNAKDKELITVMVELHCKFNKNKFIKNNTNETLIFPNESIVSLEMCKSTINDEMLELQEKLNNLIMTLKFIRDKECDIF